MNERKLPAAFSPIEDRGIPFHVEGKKNFYEHPDVPGKLMRLDGYHYEAYKELPYFKNLLEDVENRFRIPTVHPEYIVTANTLPESARQRGIKPSELDVLTVMDKIDGVSAEKILEQESIAPEVAREFDLLSQRMIGHLRDVHENGGFFCREIFRYEQFMYDDAEPAGQQLILVDVEPLGFYFNKPPFQRTAGSVPIEIIQAIADMAEDIVKVEAKIGEQLAAGSEIIDFVESIESNGFQMVEEAKLRILQALASGDGELLKPLQEFGGLLSENWQYSSSKYVFSLLEKGYEF